MTRALTVTGGTVGGEPAAVRAVDGVITAVGADVTAVAGDTLLDAGGGFVLPGLVNGHTHAAMTLFRGWGDDLPLMEWLQTRIWPAEAKLDADDVYWGTRLAIAEMLRSGTVRFWDMYWHGDAVARAVDDAGIRGVVGTVVIDGGDPARGRALRPEILAQLDAAAEHAPRVTPGLGPHAVYTVSPETLTWLGDVARDRGIPVQIHLAETEDEVLRCHEEHGVGPAALLDRCGLLGPSTVLAHCVWLDDTELDLVAERGAVIVTNPVSNMKLAVGGVFNYEAARHRGIPVGLGTDGAASNNSLDLIADAKFLSLLQKHAHNDAAAMPASEAWAVATGARAPGLGQPGALVVGAPADFVVVPPDRPELGPGDLVHNLVYAASGSVVDTVVVDGRVVAAGGVVDDAVEVRARAFECAARLGVA
ncbi:MAG: amidohydrolase [Acidimicrobiia bacterium]|jgi:5-methylthioadenosine/S-adenosylhomocysteine deaminase